MNPIIAIQPRLLAGAAVQTVDARDLHSFLEVGKDFSTWFKDRVAQYDFAEQLDYIEHSAAPQNGGAGNRGKRIEYAITLDMAKELAMVERNEKGKQARAYFIECERQAKAAAPVDPMLVLNDPAAMRGLLLTYTEKVLALQAVVAEQAPKVESFDRLMGAKGSLCLRDTAKALQLQPMKLNQWLQQHKWIYRRVGHGGFLAYQDKLQTGYLTHRVSELPSRLELSDQPRVVEQVRVTPKGLCKLAMLFNVNVQKAA